MIFISKKGIEIVLLIVSLLILTPFTFAIAPSKVQICQTGQSCESNIKVALISHISRNYLTFGNGVAGGFFDSAIVSGKTNFAFINFTNLALGSPNNPAQSFGVSLLNSNASLNSITTNTVTFISTFTQTTYTPNLPKLSFLYQNIHPISYPLLVTIIPTGVGMTPSFISPLSYYTTPSAFNSCIAPCVFLSSSNNTIIVKQSATSVSSDTIIICTGICQSVTSTSDDSAGLILLVLFIIIFYGLMLRRKREKK